MSLSLGGIFRYVISIGLRRGGEGGKQGVWVSSSTSVANFIIIVWFYFL